MEKDMFIALQRSLAAGVTPEQLKADMQALAFAQWIGAKGKGTVEGATGVGKSRIAVMAAHGEFAVDRNALVYVGVPTETLRDVEWPAEFTKWWKGWPKDKIKFVCHASMDEIRENREVNLFIFDEIHHITEKNITFFDNNVVTRVMGLSATVPSDCFPGSFDKPEAIKRIAPVIFRVSINEAKALKLISEFQIILLKFKLNSKDLSVSYTSGKEKKVTQTTEAARYLQLSKLLGKSMYSKKGGNWKFSAMQQRTDFVRNFPTKTKIAKDVLKQIVTAENRTLVFCGSIEQSIELCGDRVYNSKTSDLQLKAFTSGKINYLGAVMALNEGKNIPDLDQIFIVQISSQQRDLVQRIGRTVRWKEGLIAKVIVLVAADTVDEKWFKMATKGVDKKLIKEYWINPDV